MWDDASAADFLAGIFNGGKELDPFFDFMPGGIFGQSLDRFHCQYIRGHTGRLGDVECSFKAVKMRNPSLIRADGKTSSG
jgi:hypothetical protein